MEQILSFKSSPYGKETKYFMLVRLRMLRTCVMCAMSAMPMTDTTENK